MVVPEKRVYDPITRAPKIQKNVPITVKSSPVCCVADIPLMHLSYHAKRYGKIAIGFHRQAVVSAGFNPVMYTLENSALSNAILDGYQSIDNVSPFWAKHCVEDLSGLDIENTLSELNEIEFGESLIRSNYESILAFVKTFMADEFDSIYCEREWRSTKEFRFGVDDIAMVVLPRDANGRNYFEEFLKVTDLPRSVSISCWEDLIDH